MPLVAALERQRQVDLCKFKVSQCTWRVPIKPGLHSKALGLGGQSWGDIVTHTCNPITWELEAEVSDIQGQPQLYNEFEARHD